MGVYFKNDNYAEDHIVFTSDFKTVYRSVKDSVISGEYSPEYYPGLFPGYDKDPELFETMTPDERLNCTSGKLMSEQTKILIDENRQEAVDSLSRESVGYVFALADEQPNRSYRVVENIGTHLGDCVLSIDHTRQAEFAVTEYDEFAAAVLTKEDPGSASKYVFRALKENVPLGILEQIEAAYSQVNGDISNVEFAKLLDKYSVSLGPQVRALMKWEQPEKAKEFEEMKSKADEPGMKDGFPTYETFLEAMKNEEPIEMGDGLLYYGYLSNEEFKGYMIDLSASPDGKEYIPFGFLDLRTNIIYAEPVDIGGKTPMSFAGRNGFNVARYLTAKETILHNISESIIQEGLNILAAEGITLDRGWNREGDEKAYFEELKHAYEASGYRADVALRQTGMFSNEEFMSRLDAGNAIAMTKRYLINPGKFLEACREGAVSIDREILRKDAIFRLADLNSLKELEAEHELAAGKVKGRKM